ncbi:AAA family ATPase [Fenollaria sporofastidiosus]|uniref:AAA family ATPase n=1 Tax=Fenollaria sporofastidiosus TaxID=2811778 RepID=UPI001C00584C|nr:AAA family ATPase [Fenollaria sporofastidiosus]
MLLEDGTMNIDLKELDIFDTEYINLVKKTCFIFGNNGTGKSTFASHLKNNLGDYDVRVFQGFDSVVNSNDELNAVVLGEENVEIDNKIANIKLKIEEINVDIKDKEKLVDENNSDENNLYSKMKAAETNFRELEDKIENFYSKKASIIKNIDPKITKTTYNKNDFKNDINMANLLSNEEQDKYNDILKYDIKNAKKIDFENINFDNELNRVNELLTKSVQPSKKISRLDNNDEKREFAKKGLKIHKEGEVCSFCGNLISRECFDELKQYFSGEDIKKFENQLHEEEKILNQNRENINKINLDSENFYVQYYEKVIDLEKSFLKLKKEILEFYEKLIDIISNKQKRLFEPMEQLNIKTPDNLEEILNNYNKLCDLNNNTNIENQKDDARNNLRLHMVKESLLEFEHTEKKDELTKLEFAYGVSKVEFNKVKKEIENLNTEKSNLDKEILELKASSKNEEKLATEINKRLAIYVNFNLLHCKDGQNGCYRVKDKQTGKVRDVKQLSTGEKNIIAFLYFLEKLEELNSGIAKKKKVIIFDDPMNSNDINMQYIIIDELNKLIEKANKNDYIEKLIIMTHNHHFYINLAGFPKTRYRVCDHLRFVSNGINTNVITIANKNEDFKSSYDSLWQDLNFVYSSKEGSAGLLCNISRRIIDSFINFNSMTKNDFYKDNGDAKKLFDVNSHELYDFDADFFGLDKNKIIKTLYKCFESNNAKEHFKNYFNTEDIEEIINN